MPKPGTWVFILQEGQSPQGLECSSAAFPDVLLCSWLRSEIARPPTGKYMGSGIVSGCLTCHTTILAPLLPLLKMDDMQSPF